MKIKRRLGLGGAELYKQDRTTSSRGGRGCPDILELDTGDFLVIGDDVTSEVSALPFGATCAEGERIIKIPHAILLSAFEEWSK